MCFNCIIITSDNNRVSSAIIKSLVKKMLNNPHGFAVYLYPSQKLVRTLNFRKALKALLKLHKNTNAHIHFRFATSGAISIDNIHLWDIRGFLVSHNGYVSSYAYTYHISPHISPANHISDSDSKRFVHSNEFQKALESRDFNSLWDLAMNKGFYGFMLMTSKDFDEIYIMTNKPFYVYSKGPIKIISNEKISEDSEIRTEYGIYRYRNDNLERIVKPKLEQLEHEHPVRVRKYYYSYIYGYDDDPNYYGFKYLFDDFYSDDNDKKECSDALTIYEWIKCKTKKFKAKHKTKENKKNKNEYKDYAFF